MTDALDIDDYVENIRAGSRVHIARAITVAESSRPDHQELADELLQRLTPLSGGAIRVGITGVPGAGKSTFIDALGTDLVNEGSRVAVLAVDPSSSRTGGSILADRTRMGRLSASDDAFVRPSPTSGVLGGVSRATSEAIIIVEAAGYDVVLVETVGVGQSEVAVANMVDCFLLLGLARTGDQLQGIKRGVLELADIVVINKADGAHQQAAEVAARELAGALRLSRPADADWAVPVLACSALTGYNLQEVWTTVVRHQDLLRANGELPAKRARQRIAAAWAIVADRLISSFRADARVQEVASRIEADLRAGSTSPRQAAATLIDAHQQPM